MAELRLFDVNCNTAIPRVRHRRYLVHSRADTRLVEGSIETVRFYRDTNLMSLRQSYDSNNTAHSMSNNPNPFTLIDANDSLLIIIDVQEVFLNKLAQTEKARLLNTICWLAELAQWRQIPLLVTAEEIDTQPLAPTLSQMLPTDTAIFNKLTFGLAHQPDILACLESTQRKTTVLVGLETDVCVMHSALGLLEKGYRVAVVADATGSPAPGHEIGLTRMKNAGAIVVNMKSLFYEWLRTVEMVNRFHREMPHMREKAGVVL